MANLNYITRNGYFILEQELKNLLQLERPMVTKAVSEAAALGDRSENAEYIYGKKRLREIDRCIRFLTKKLKTVKIVDYNPVQEGKVFFGAYVTLLDDNAKETKYRLVGADEFDVKKRWISIASPVAKSLIGHKVNDEITVNTPNGKKKYTIVAIEYDK